MDDVREQLGRIIHHEDQFKKGHKNVTCVPDNLTEVVNKALQELMTPPQQWALDETVIACEIKRAPTVWLPRKPHETGLRVYSCVAMIDSVRRPFSFGIINDGRTDHLRLDEILKSAEECYDSSGVEPFEMTADAFFEKVDWLTELGDER